MLLDAQPASTMPYTPIDVIAKITSRPTFTSAAARWIGLVEQPEERRVAPNGTTANAANAAVAESIGAR